MTPEQAELEIKCLRQQLLNLQDMFCNHVHEGTTDKPLIIRQRQTNNQKPTKQGNVNLK
jgi:hypothetical protein